MQISGFLNSRFHYFLEGIVAHKVAVKIDHFGLNREENEILVFYRLGRQKLTQKTTLSDLCTKFYENLSGYDRQRVTKFSTLQDLINNLFSNEDKVRQELINYLKEVIKNDQLF